MNDLPTSDLDMKHDHESSNTSSSVLRSAHMYNLVLTMRQPANKRSPAIGPGHEIQPRAHTISRTKK